MLLTEIKSEFEILFEDLATAGTIGLNDYEKSVCLTHAQEDLAKQLAGESDYDALASLTTTVVASTPGPGSYPNSITFPHQSAIKNIDRWAVSTANKEIYITEVHEAVIRAMLTSPYKYPPKNVGYMVYADVMVDDVFLPLGFNIVSYNRRVIEYPSPIILTDISPETINNISVPTDPVIHKDYHRKIVEMAVQFAIKVYVGVEEKSTNQG